MVLNKILKIIVLVLISVEAINIQSILYNITI
jgi:hypothetical protein